MRGARLSRLLVIIGIAVLLVLTQLWQHRVMLCEDALTRRRMQTPSYAFAERDVRRYCLTWVGGW